MKGHKPEYFKQGPNDAFWHVRCECGWQTKAVFIRKRSYAALTHREHVERVTELGTDPSHTGWTLELREKAEQLLGNKR